jgi:hypothetical protein
MAKKKGELVVVEPRFDYSPLEAEAAEKVRAAAEKIRQTVKRTIEDIIEVGSELLAVKEALPHGKFGPWLRAEFGWTERTAQNFMSVAEVFGRKNEIISDLSISPTAAYLLAAPSAPEEAREAAVRLAEEGQPVTAKVAKQILAKERKKPGKRGRKAAGDDLGERLQKMLGRMRDRWDQKQLHELARQLREFADSLVEGKAGPRKKGQ